MGRMTESVAVARLSSRALVRVSGPEWRTFLQGLLSQDVDSLRDGEIRFAGLLNPQGRLLFDLFLIGRDDGVLLDVAADRRDDLIRRLTMYRLRAKVELAAVDDGVFALWSGDESPGQGWLRDPRLPELGWRGYGVDAPAGQSVQGEEAYDAWRLSLAVPDPAKDCPFESDYPIEANFDLLGGIDFKKGCFVGQETTSRMKRRGTVKSRMVGLAYQGEAPAFGAEILAGELRAGEVRTAHDGRAIALVRLDRIAGAALTVEGRPVQVLNPNYNPTGQET